MSANTILIWAVVHGRSDLEISVSRRRRQRPFQSGRVPRISRRFRTFEHAVEETNEERDGREPQPERAQADEDLQRLLASQAIIPHRISDSQHHPIQPQVVGGKERQVKEHERQNEVHFAPELVHHPAKHLRIPEVDRTKHTE